ncbi:hypothetical protein [Streptomyces griseofuscus]|uniref:hypothetical protein n=1 Tax=Streptomyces griseofuscus TaxID=146922 RepID=UPI003456080C
MVPSVRRSSEPLAADPRRHARLRRLHVRQLRLSEAALMIEGWSAEPGALPAGWSGPALRRRLLEAYLAIDAPAAAAETLAEDIPSDLAGRDPRPSREVSVKRTGRGAHEAPPEPHRRLPGRPRGA